jgi:hypothetical protein
LDARGNNDHGEGIVVLFAYRNTAQTSGNMFLSGLGISYLQYLFVVCKQPPSSKSQQTNSNDTSKNINNSTASTTSEQNNSSGGSFIGR